MAKCKKNKTNVVLTLTPAEAQVLMQILYCIGGDPQQSARKFTDNIANSMNKSGIKYSTVISDRMFEYPHNYLTATKNSDDFLYSII